MLIVHTDHVKYILMDYVTHRLSEQDRTRVEQHLKICSKCHRQFVEMSAVGTLLKQDHRTAPTPVYFSTILPRVRERLVSRRRSAWNYYVNISKIILPLAVSVFLVILLTRTHTDAVSESAQAEALHQAMVDLNEDEMLQAIEKEYAGSSLSPNLEVAAAGVAEHLDGDQFLKTAVSKQIENEEVADMDIDGMISDLDGEQIELVLSSLSERNNL